MATVTLIITASLVSLTCSKFNLIVTSGALLPVASVIRFTGKLMTTCTVSDGYIYFAFHLVTTNGQWIPMCVLFVSGYNCPNAHIFHCLSSIVSTAWIQISLLLFTRMSGNLYKTWQMITRAARFIYSSLSFSFSEIAISLLAVNTVPLALSWSALCF